MNAMKEVLHWVLPKLYRQGKVALVEEFKQKALAEAGTWIVFTPNPEQVVQASTDASFFAAWEVADVFLPDGSGLLAANWIWRQRFTNQSSLPIPGVIAGREVVEYWLKKGGADHRVSTLLLGAHSGVAEALARQVDPPQEWCHGLMGYTRIADLFTDQPSQRTLAEDAAVRQAVIRWQPQVIFVAFGAPWQERWVQRMEKFLEEQGVRVVMVCGGALDSLVGKTPFMPAIIGVLHLEWLFRLITQPWRWRRQLRLITFVREVLF